jgi:tRNA dimethylallyltransferase
LVGGTALYLKALLHGLFEGPPANQAVRRRLTEEAEQRGPACLHQRLAQVDPASAARLHANDVRRVVRALEVWELSGRPMSAWQTQWKSADDSSSPRCCWLDLPRAELYRRIDARVQHMIDAGLVDEVRALRRLQQPLSREASQALGYKELFAYLENQATLEQTIIRIQTRSRNFAKRQLTWFRNLKNCQPVSKELTMAAWGLKMD